MAALSGCGSSQGNDPSPATGGSAGTSGSGGSSGGKGGATGGTAGSSGASTGGTGGAITPTATADEVAAVCATFSLVNWPERCCSADEQQALPGLYEQFQDFVDRDCEDWLLKSASQGRIRISQEALDAAAAYTGPTCSVADGVPLDHRSFVIGLQELGEPCTDNHECVDGLVCNVGGYTSGPAGACVAPGVEKCRALNSFSGRPVNLVVHSLGYHPRCADGYSCSFSSEIGTCGTSSRGCSDQEDCPVGQYCQIDGTCGAQRYVPDGNPCSYSSDCLPGSYCHDEMGVCTPKKADGGDCSAHGLKECLGHCENATCVSYCSSG